MSKPNEYMTEAKDVLFSGSLELAVSSLNYINNTQLQRNKTIVWKATLPLTNVKCSQEYLLETWILWGRVF